MIATASSTAPFPIGTRIALLACRVWHEVPGSGESQPEENDVPDQDSSVQTGKPDLQTALQSLLQSNLSDQELRERVRALVDAPQETTAQPTTDDATEHPGYQ